MIKHIYTLRQLTDQIRFLVGSSLTECIIQEKDVACLIFDDGDTSYVLEISLRRGLEAFYLKRNFAKARHNVKRLFPEAEGEILQSAELVENDRIIRLRFVGKAIYLFLNGRPAFDMALVNKENKVISSFFKKNFQQGEELRYDSAPHTPVGEYMDKDENIHRLLTRSEAVLGEHYAREFCMRHGYDPGTLLQSLDQPQKDRLADHVRNFISDLGSAREYYLYRLSQSEYLASLTDLSAYEKVRNFDDISEAVHSRVVKTLNGRAYAARYGLMRKELAGIIRKAEDSLAKIEGLEGAAEKEARLRQNGELLFSHPEPKKKYGASLQMTGWDGKKIIIALDEKKNLLENGEGYFAKAKKVKKEYEVLEKRLPEIRRKLDVASECSALLDKATGLKDLARIERGYPHLFTRIIEKENKKEPSQKFRVFPLPQGYTLYVGKNSANNDELTLHFAKPGDIWLHARGTGGSHCIIRRKGNEAIPLPVISKAAEIAAYFSQARKSEFVAVIYTEKKYVRKPKGAPPGSVTVTKEKVVMADPILPRKGVAHSDEA